MRLKLFVLGFFFFFYKAAWFSAAQLASQSHITGIMFECKKTSHCLMTMDSETDYCGLQHDESPTCIGIDCIIGIVIKLL